VDWRDDRRRRADVFTKIGRSGEGKSAKIKGKESRVCDSRLGFDITIPYEVLF
jgi:hypothetical protein